MTHSIYHFFTPWEVITRILAITPLAYSVMQLIRQKRSLSKFACFGVYNNAMIRLSGNLEADVWE